MVDLAGGNAAAGLAIILTVLVIHFLVAFMVSEGATVESSPAGCSSSNNATTCSNVGGTTFLQALLSITFTGWSGEPIVDGLYLLLVGGGFIAGIILLSLGIAGGVFGGG